VAPLREFCELAQLKFKPPVGTFNCAQVRRRIRRRLIGGFVFKAETTA
jgi:hypothetical protein